MSSEKISLWLSTEETIILENQSVSLISFLCYTKHIKGHTVPACRMDQIRVEYTECSGTLETQFQPRSPLRTGSQPQALTGIRFFLKRMQNAEDLCVLENAKND